METSFRLAMVAIGVIGLVLYFRSIIRLMLLNRNERNFVEEMARAATVTFIHSFARKGDTYEHIQRIQAWAAPIFLFVAIATWFLLVQFSFSLILWGLYLEVSWPRAFSSSGSALSTLGYLTPPTLLGEYLATYEAAIGLVIVAQLFTFIPGYQAAVQVRERKVGWLYARAGQYSTCIGLLQVLKKQGRIDDPTVWEDWEGWFRGIYETHSIAPILAYVPSVYRSTSWVGTSAAVLDATSLILSSLDPKMTEAARLCRETGILTVNLVASEIGRGSGRRGRQRHYTEEVSIADFDRLYDIMVDIGLPMRTDRDGCRSRFSALRNEYAGGLRSLSESTLMPADLPWDMGERGVSKGT